jgi:hypothetical protein|tara:strand:+ start:2549 stop:2872 length:324 start_codon:yes stop_codon:yes gene_type:complete
MLLEKHNKEKRKMNILERIADARGEQWFGGIFLSAITAGLILAFVAFSADHSIRCYYLANKGTDAGISYNIMADVDWRADLKTFTNSDARLTLSVFSTMKQCAAKES